MKKQWSSELAFVIASTASAIGIGNIWRFSSVIGENGGGTFLLVYLAFVFLLGIPILLLEFLIGKTIRKTAYKCFQYINKKFSFLFIFPFLFNFVILSYYVVITGWTLFYFLSSLVGYHIPFEDFTGSLLPFLFTIVIIFLLFIILRLNIKEGLERINLYLFPLLIISLLILFVNIAGMSGFSKMISFYTTINLQTITPHLLVAAAAQLIFALSVGYGIMLTYASYSKKSNHMARAAVEVTIGETSFAFLASMVIFSLVFTYGIDEKGGTKLAFEALPLIASSMPFGTILLSIFFFMLFTAALTSALAMQELFITNIEDISKFDRKKAAMLAAGILFVISVPSALSYSHFHSVIRETFILDFLDGVIVEKSAPLVVLVTVMYLAWGFKDLKKVAEKKLSKTIAPVFLTLIKYVVPIILGAVFIFQFL